MAPGERTGNRCTECDGPWHPATGAEYSRSCRLCRRCEERFWTWVRGRLYWLASVEQGHHAPGKKRSKKAP